MDRFSENQVRIEQRQVETCVRFTAMRSSMIAEQNSPDPVDQVQLMYSANYLFRTDNIRWAIDPLTLNWRIQDTPQVNVARGLCNSSLVLFTHEHKDHPDVDLPSSSRDIPFSQVMPQFILSTVMEPAHLPRENIIIPSALKAIELYGIHI